MTILEILSVLCAGQLFLFGGYTFFSSSPARRALSHFLLANAVFILDYLLKLFYFSGYYQVFPLMVWGASAGYLFGPLLYFYTSVITGSNHRPFLHKLPHFFPAFVFLAGFAVPFHFAFNDNELRIPSIGGIELSGIATGLMLLHVLFYLIPAIRLVSTYSVSARESYSSEKAVELPWLKTTLYAFTAMWCVDLLMFFLRIAGVFIPLSANEEEVISLSAGILSLGINLVFANVIILQGLKQNDSLPVNIKREEEYPSTVKADEESNRPGRLSVEEKIIVLEKLEQCMRTKKLFLRPNLSIAELASEVKVQSRFISQAINDELGKNFFDYINSFRVEECMRLLAEPKLKNLTITAIMYDAGFNSKSVFNTSFKRQLGCTPSEYRKSVHREAVA